MISLIFAISLLVFQKEQFTMPFVKVDSITNQRYSIHYKCAESWVKTSGYIPIYMDEKFVGIGYPSHIDKDNFVHARMYLNTKVDGDKVLRMSLKVSRSEFHQDGCYWEIKEAYITKFFLSPKPRNND